MSELKPDQLAPWQAQAMTIPEDYDLAAMGGRAGGKSRFLAALFLRHCEQYKEQARCLVVRRSFPGLQDLESEFRAFFHAIYGNGSRYDAQKHRFTLPNGATIQLDQLERDRPDAGTGGRGTDGARSKLPLTLLASGGGW